MCASTAIASQSPCTPKCMPSSLSRACPLLSRSRFKASSGGFHSVHQQNQGEHQQHQQGEEKEPNNGRRSPKGAPLLRGVSQGPGLTKRMAKLRVGKKCVKRPSSSGCGRGKQGSSSSTSENSSSGEASGSESSGRDTPARASSPTPEGFVNVQMDIGGKGARWDQRRRDPRANGADIYVARITKSGCGNARPCWRCLEWCKWAGIKRIFHWNEETHQFDVVKVNNAPTDQYETHADNRLFAGLVRLPIVQFPKLTDRVLPFF